MYKGRDGYVDITLFPLEGGWEIPFKEIKKLVEEEKLYLHPYMNRQDDLLNAKDSYFIDLRTFEKYCVYKKEE